MIIIFRRIIVLATSENDHILVMPEVHNVGITKVEILRRKLNMAKACYIFMVYPQLHEITR